jgi:hypothetical protein
VPETRGGCDVVIGHQTAALAAEDRYLKAREELLLAKDALLLEAWFLMKQRQPDSPVNVRMQTWAGLDVRRLLVVLNVLRLFAEGKTQPLTF